MVTKALIFFTQATLQAEDTYQIVEEIPTENNEQGNSYPPKAEKIVI